jgi:hypothetical protein
MYFQWLDKIIQTTSENGPKSGAVPRRPHLPPQIRLPRAVTFCIWQRARGSVRGPNFTRNGKSKTTPTTASCGCARPTTSTTSYHPGLPALEIDGAVNIDASWLSVKWGGSERIWRGTEPRPSPSSTRDNDRRHRHQTTRRSRRAAQDGLAHAQAATLATREASGTGTGGAYPAMVIRDGHTLVLPDPYGVS